MAKHIPARRVPRDRRIKADNIPQDVFVPQAHSHVEADITDLSHITVTISTSAPSGGGTTGDLWCRV